jgi:isopenicillin-N epimerase
MRKHLFSQQAEGFDWRSLWSLDHDITFLNHGSFGACPIAILEYQQTLRAQMEAEPVRFFAIELEPMLDQARQVLADFVGAAAEGLVFVPNATTGVNTVLRSLSLQPGDELLTTNHEYNASRNALDFAAQRSGAKVVVMDVPLPIEDPRQIVDAVLAGVSEQTRLVLVDHISSQTGLTFPLQELIKALHQKGVEILVDGAHAPGMVPLNLQELGATYYTGNCHKWMCNPKGAAFLAIATEKCAQLRPLVISHGANSQRVDRSRFFLEFDWTGTADPTPYLCVPETIRYMGSLLPGGWAELMASNRQKTLAARELLCQALKADPPCPPEMIGAMAVLPLPNGNVESLKNQLFEQFSIEVPIIPWVGLSNRLIRISAQLYNTPTDYDVLARALVTLLAEE